MIEPEFKKELGAAKLLIKRHGGKGAAQLIAKAFMLMDPPESLFVLTSKAFMDMLTNIVDEQAWEEWKRLYPDLTKGL